MRGVSVTVLLAVFGAASAQTPRGRPSNADLAILDAQAPRRDLPCKVTAIEPVFGFDLRLHAGYAARIRLRDLVGPEGRLNVVFRVEPRAREAATVYFTDFARIPQAEGVRKGQIEVGGAFGLGEGKYRVDWLVRDQTGRVCSSHWEVEAALPKRAAGAALIAPARVEASALNPFRRERPSPATSNEAPLKIKVLVNFASRRPSPAILQPQNLNPVLSALRSLVREPRFGRFSVVAFLLTDQRVFFRQEESAGIDFPGIGRALRSLDLGTVGLERFSQERGQKWFLADLIKEGALGENRPDALIIVSPSVALREDIPPGELKKLGPLSFPVFYLECGRTRVLAPADAIGRAMGRLHGREYRILRPEDIARAVGDLVVRITGSRGGRGAGKAGAGPIGASTARPRSGNPGVE